MKSMIKIALVLMLALAPETTKGQSLPSITNGDFETGDLTGWTKTGDFSVRDVSEDLGYKPEGNYGASSDAGVWNLELFGSIRSEDITLPSDRPIALRFFGADSALMYNEGVYVKKSSDDTTVMFVPPPWRGGFQPGHRSMVYPLMGHEGETVYILVDDQRVDAQIIVDDIRFSDISHIIDNFDSGGFDSNVWESTEGWAVVGSGAAIWPTSGPMSGQYCAQSIKGEDGTRLLKSKPFSVSAGDSILSFFGVAYQNGGIDAALARLKDASDDSEIANIRVGYPNAGYQYWFSHTLPLDQAIGKNVYLEFEITSTSPADINYMSIDAICVLGEDSGPPPPVSATGNWAVFLE